MRMFNRASINITSEAQVDFRDPARATQSDAQPANGDASTDVTDTKQDSKSNDGKPVRAQWNNKAEFLLSCISLSVGLGNVWRFPYVAYANGGGAFLIPYIIVLLLVGKPMYFMEIAFGQYHSQGPVKVWKRSVPFAKGVGVAQVAVCFFVAIFYVILMSWTMFYFWTTLIAAIKSEPVPWADFCNHEYAFKESCVSFSAADEKEIPTLPVVVFTNVSTDGFKPQSAAQQYFDRVVLNKYKKATLERYTLSNMGDVNLGMLGCLAGSWLLVCLSLLKGVKSSGKVVYITSTMPFIVLFILLGRGASLEGAVEGIKYFVIPQFDKLLVIDTWRAAAEQMFFSLSVAYGSLTMLGSYNQFNNNCYQDGLIVSVMDSLTSITSGLAMFSVLGYLAGRLDVGVESVVSSGPGLAFVTFPEALTQMPVPHLWGILFFIMLYTLGLGSEIGLLESVLTFVCDRYPVLRTKRPYVAAVGCTICFLIGIPFITQGGEELFNIFNDYAAGLSVLFIAIFEVSCIMWIYGAKRFVNNLQKMLGDKGKMGVYIRTAWIVLSPAILIFILVMSVIVYKPSHDPERPTETIPAWGDALGWVLVVIAAIQIPIWAGVEVYKAKGITFKEKLYQSLWPDEIMVPEHGNTVEMAAIDSERNAYPSNGEKAAYVNTGYTKDE
ncbi:Sodium- and chloride-dependent glycine transporter 2 [Hypsibius exemplaris]|uniref:Transporter n=1 Tax=Hypsibius exemplaris TaxID=2072580 RepID=A0A1W0WVC3_HYPEX|nr:Sodium- and chloride-dependent glycine transporter 2 [Hypsibius exemplaris]